MKEHRIRHACRLALATALLPFAVGTSAQSAMHWKGTVSRAAQPTHATTSGLPNPLDADTRLADGFDVQRFEAVANHLVANGRIPGLAMAIVKDGRILSSRGYGVTDARNGEPVDAHTVFRLASLSKSFAGTVTGMLQAFQGLSMHLSTTTPVQLVDGISNALITTVGGLVVGIPAMAFFSFFRARSTRLIGNLEVMATELLTVMVKRSRT